MRLTRSPSTSARRRSRRGRPLWQALAALVLLPIMAATGLAWVALHSANRAATQALHAQKLVAAIELLDTARRSVDTEVLPTMLLGALDDEQQAAALGFAPPRRAVLRATVPAALNRDRATTDRAMDAALAAPSTPAVVATLREARADLRSLRSAADQDTESFHTVAHSYGLIAQHLASAQRRASAEAISAGLSTESVAALQDLDRVVQLSEVSSNQLAILFASRVMLEPAASITEREWVASWGTYTQLLSRPGDLSTPAVRTSWTAFQASDDATAFSSLLDRQALDPHDDVIETGALPGLVARSGRRDEAVAIVLDDAVTAVTGAVGIDHAAAVARERKMLEICLLLALLTLLDAGLVARWLTVSMRHLAVNAQQISRGNLVDVEPHGPRELRTAATALSSAVAGLRRVQEQAHAVVSGDLEAALRQQPLPGPLGEVVHASVEQIVGAFQAQEALRDELAHQASHDALTGLPNRAQTLRNLTAALHRGQREGRNTGLLFIDLDAFKAVNDGHGHAAGDELLRTVARRLETVVRGGDAIGRLGGDEFVVIVEGAADAHLVELGARLITALSEPVTLETGAEVHVGASIGVSVAADADISADVLLAEGDTAAYRAKHLGRGRVEVFDDALRRELTETADLETALRDGLAAGQLSLHYQPVVSLQTGALEGYEALARWTRPGVGPVRPDVFIAAAEASSLVCDIGRWALAEATSQLAQWRAGEQAGFAPGQQEPTVAVNLSGRHLADPRVLDDVADALDASGLPARLLVVEITETVLADDLRVRHHLQALRALGISVAIDDFGTGFTSIGALSTTPADILKIDRCFVASDDPAQHQLATLITRAAHTFSLRVVVEGVETAAQLERARADRCESVQGYLFSRPLPPDEVERLQLPLTPPGSLVESVPTPRSTS